MSKHMFRIGDRVTIRSDLKEGRYPCGISHESSLYCNDDMARYYAGKTAVVIGVGVVGADKYTLDIDEGQWFWCGAMFSDDEENPCCVPLLFDD